MTKIATIISFMFIYGATFSQGQIGNGDLENWENVAAPTEEPVNWNSFKTGSGTFSGFASKQIERSASIRSGATGMYCARIFSVSTLGIVANGTMTLGQINMGSTTPSNAANYNYSKTADANFSEALVGSPDSIVFWAKYTPMGSGVQEARIHAILHDAYDVHDPIDAGSTPHVVATAAFNYPSTNGSWVRYSVPFTYNGAATVPAFILVTFATNAIPGGGAAADEVLLDDISLIYNNAGITENTSSDLSVHFDSNNGLHFFSNHELQGEIVLYNAMGAVAYKGALTSQVMVKLTSGVYFANYFQSNGNNGVLKFIVE